MSMKLSFNFKCGEKLLAAGGPAPSANLLLWSESLENPAWTLTDGDIVATDQDGTADEFSSTRPGASIRQITSIAATSGVAATFVISPTPTLDRYSVTGSFDGLPYTLSFKIKDTGIAAVPSLTLRLDRSGGLLRCSIEDPAGDGNFIVGYAQLEQAEAFTSYHFRGGT